ncbi:glucose-6-phosphate isomerase 1, chloroplastic-like [Hibiscus syriacus]|uniref:glucose-6-phosphate isomerase 1, chloroplastic-like n=1 Tax=Hibiscus syriacus TaxID=106335 RepID=UPI00192125AE|nr:glucose-6-phosphate isomerase 1, chloroplastic-like [Hibiscus syriacus]
MASLSSLFSSFPSLKLKPNPIAELNPSVLKYTLPFSTRSNSGSKLSVAPEVSIDFSKTNDVAKQGGLEKDPKALLKRYVDWLYQHKELGLYLDVSRIGLSNEFVFEIEPQLQADFKAMDGLEKGAIANPDEVRMVGHYWLRNAKLEPSSFLQVQIDNTLAAISNFADDIISGKIKPPPSPEGRFTQILSVGIGGSALGPQFVAEALAPDNPLLKVC